MTTDAPEPAVSGAAEIDVLRQQLAIADLEARIAEARARVVVAQARVAEARLSMQNSRRAMSEARPPTRMVLPEE